MKMVKSSPKGVENTVGKGEIARYEQFLLFPQCFQKTCSADTLKPELVWERDKDCLIINMAQVKEFDFRREDGTMEKEKKRNTNEHMSFFSVDIFESILPCGVRTR